MKKIFLSLYLLFALGLMNIAAQDYVGTYSGTLTVTPEIYPADISTINLNIPNQELQVSSDMLFFIDIPIFKGSDAAPVTIGFPNAEFALNGDISAPEIAATQEGIVPVKFSLVSGNVSGNTINLTFRMIDTVNGAIADVTFNYTGTKITTGIDENTTDDNRVVVGYYSITGQKLSEKPQKGFYIVVYDDGSSEKVIQ
jgi:hypothetical protein